MLRGRSQALEAAGLAVAQGWGWELGTQSSVGWHKLGLSPGIPAAAPIFLLDEAGVKPDMIKSLLRWMGDSYRLYLRDTAKINQQHNKALEKASAEVMTLLSNNIDNLLVEEVPEADNSMGEYVEFD